MMKILSISAQKPHSTGSGTYLTELVRTFDDMGHRQVVVCGIYPYDRVSFPQGVLCYPVLFTDESKEGSGFERGLIYPDADFVTEAEPPCRISYPIVGMSDEMPYPSTQYKKMTGGMIEEFEAAFIKTITRAVTDLDPDLIICHHLFFLTALVRKHFPDRKVYGISHGTDLRQMYKCEKLRGLVQPYINRLDMAFALHDEQAEQIKKVFGIDDSRVKVIGSGYDHKRFNTLGRKARSSDSPVRICYAGKLSKAKGIPELLSALDILSADKGTPKFELCMAGGCRDDDVRKLLDNLPGYARWLGFIPGEELTELYKNSDIFILPSYYEGLPLVIMESMASGALPICTDLPGVRKWIDDHVPDSNVRYIPMPEMDGPDTPSAAGREKFIRDLCYAIKAAVKDIDERILPGTTPDTDSATWYAVASRILKGNK